MNEPTPHQRLQRIHELQNIEAEVLAMLDELHDVLNRLFEERAFLVMEFPPDPIAESGSAEVSS